MKNLERFQARAENGAIKKPTSRMGQNLGHLGGLGFNKIDDHIQYAVEMDIFEIIIWCATWVGFITH